MRREELEPLSEPYSQPKDVRRDRRFDRSIGADILISDYLYQCADSIETNLWRRDFITWNGCTQGKERTIDLQILFPEMNMAKLDPSSRHLLHRLMTYIKKLEGLHICGFFRAIGSSLDCLGAAIVGVLALSTSLRRSDILKAESILARINSSSPGYQPRTTPIQGDMYMSHPILYHRLLAGALDDAHRQLWDGSKWNQ
jgi:hypothetical protein